MTYSPRIRAIVPTSRPDIPLPQPPEAPPVGDAVQQLALDKFNTSVDTVILGDQANSQIVDQLADNLSGSY